VGSTNTVLASLDLLWPRLSEATSIYPEVSSVNVREAKVERKPRSRTADLEPSLSPTRMVDKQLWQALKNGQLITFLIFDGDPVTGYLAGMDDETYFVLEPRKNEFFKKIFIKKYGNPMFEIHAEHSYTEDIPYFDEMEKIIAPFRTYVLHNHLGQQNRNGSRVRTPVQR
jgi:hypothetical protein